MPQRLGSQRVLGEACLLCGTDEPAVLEFWHKALREAESDAGDGVLAPEFFLEDASPVAIPAFLAPPDAFRPVRQADAFHVVCHVLDLHAVCPDVLHGSGSDLSGNEREVLHPVPSSADGVPNELVAHFAGAHFHRHFVGILFQQTHSPDVRFQHHAVVVTEEKQVAAAADVQNRQMAVLLPYDGNCVAKLILRAVGEKHTRLCLYAKSILNFHILSDASCPSPL